MKRLILKVPTIKIVGGGYLSIPLQVYIFFMLCSMSLLTMTASKCQKEDIVYFTVKFNSNRGSAVDSIRLASGNKVAKPTDPTRNNYTFDGWYLDNYTFQQAFDFNTAITANITLYAKWKVRDGLASYTVTFNSNGGSAVYQETLASGDQVMQPTDPTLSGFTFEGWYSDDMLTKVFDFNTAVTTNITLYAKWKYHASLSLSTTVVGMREFLLSATLTDTGTVSFIVTESAIAPTWTAVENNKAKMVRKFTADKLTRQVYCSATDSYTDPTQGKFVNLVGQADVIAYTKAEAPGIMIPGQTYYVHAYIQGKLLKSTDKITLADYPSTYPTPYRSGQYPPDPFNGNSTTEWSWGSNLWGMNMWIGKQSLELRPDEVYFIPLRTMDPYFNGARGECLVKPTSLTFQSVILSSSKRIEYLTVDRENNNPGVGVIDAIGYLFGNTVFTTQSSYDIMIGRFITSRSEVYQLFPSSNCAYPDPNPKSITWQITAISE